MATKKQKEDLLAKKEQEKVERASRAGTNIPIFFSHDNPAPGDIAIASHLIPSEANIVSCAVSVESSDEKCPVIIKMGKQADKQGKDWKVEVGKGITSIDEKVSLSKHDIFMVSLNVPEKSKPNRITGYVVLEIM